MTIETWSEAAAPGDPVTGSARPGADADAGTRRASCELSAGPGARDDRLTASGAVTDLTGRQRRQLRIWIGSGALLTFLIIIIGGITRLTQSGLSIVDWSPIVGTIPPLSHADWEAAFASYRQFPEYIHLREGMTLAEFQFIFFWEYLHRLAARTIGIVFLIPFLWFWRSGHLDDRSLRRKVLALFALGGLQGTLGWFMVMSGLVDEPRVSHYRLAAHLTVALVIFGYCVWLMRELADPQTESTNGRMVAYRGDLPWIRVLGGLLGLQIIWGAFVAGLDAGYIHNTFPLMGDRIFPQNGWSLQPGLLNLTENPVTVQWVHRFLGTALLLAGLAAFRTHFRRAEGRETLWLPGAFAALLSVQYLLGVVTLLRHVPVALGVAHQATAVLILGCWLVWLHRARSAGAVAAPG